MVRSDIFNEFVKIAQDKGLVSEDAPEKAKKKLEKDPRVDSLSISDIESLYSTKHDRPKGMEYKKNIIESAHPKSVVMAPSYDKINGLVENDQERQNIILNIVNKEPNGQLTHAKYAEKELILSLVRIGNLLDLQDKNELRKLSDVCLQDVANKSLKKTAALPPLVWGIAAGVSALLGGLYAQQHMAFVNDGFEKNHQKLIDELDDLLESNSDWGVGYQYSAKFKSMILDFKNKLLDFYKVYQKVLPLINNLEKPRTAQELMELANKSETKTVIESYRKFRDAANNMLPYIMTIEKDFASESYKNRQIEDKGFLTSLVDKLQIFHGGKGLVADDFDDVVRAVAPYKKSIAEMMEVLKQAESLEKDAKSKIEQASLQSQKEFGSDIDNKSDFNSKKKFDQDIEELDKDLSGILL